MARQYDHSDWRVSSLPAPNNNLKRSSGLLPGGFTDARSDDVGINRRAGARGAGELIFIVYCEQAEAGTEPLSPLEVVEVGPVEVAVDINA